MAFLSGLIILDCPASALNNAGAREGARVENAIGVKFIRTREGAFPYVSAQAFRYWLRSTLENSSEIEWRSAPIYRASKIAYTDANPIKWWDDDLFGYMRAESKKTDAATIETQTPVSTEITRVSPFRVSTLVSITPVSIVDDFGTMSRQEGNPVPFEHQFYRAFLRGLISLDLKAVGTFSYKDRTGFRNLDDNRKKEAEEEKLEHLDNDKSYRLPLEQRVKRINSLLQGLGQLYGGAMQALHYTDITPKIFIGVITKGGNNPLQYIVGVDSKGTLAFNGDALIEMLNVWRDQIISKLYIGWVKGFYDAQRQTLQEILGKLTETIDFSLDHPRIILQEVANDIKNNSSWLY